MRRPFARNSPGTAHDPGLILGLVVTLLLSGPAVRAGFADPPRGAAAIDIGDRLEPFIDLFLVDRMEGVSHELNHPVEIWNLHDRPAGGWYATVIYENQKYRYYCRETIPGYTGSTEDGNPGEATVYQESNDGMTWTRPNLDLFEVNGSRSNNYLRVNLPPYSHNFSPFLDTRPDCPPDERFKALAGVHASGLAAFASADGIRWRKLREDPVITSEAFAFDSQNVAFWSATENAYVTYFRTWKTPSGQFRTFSRATSTNFLDWSAAEPVNANLENEHLYTSQAHPYFRAPHIIISLATRILPERGHSTDIVLMSSRDGRTFDRVFKQAFIRPAPTPESWRNRGNYAALNVFPLRDHRPGIEAEHWRYKFPMDMGIIVRDRVYRLPVDGFASIHAAYGAGEMLTRPLLFSGSELRLNYQTSAGGGVGVEIQDEHGQVIPGYAIADMKEELRGDVRGQAVLWKQGSDVGKLAGRPIRLRFVLRDADLYAIRFVAR